MNVTSLIVVIRYEEDWSEREDPKFDFTDLKVLISLGLEVFLSLFKNP